MDKTGAFFNLNFKTGVQYGNSSSISSNRQIGGETMTIRTKRDDANYRSLNINDWQGDTRQVITPQTMPNLSEPFEQDGDCHWLLWHDPVNVTLWYDRQCEMWTVRFDWPDIVDLQFKRDEPAMKMREAIIEAIDNRWQEPDRIPF